MTAAESERRIVDIVAIFAELEAERDRLKKAIAALKQGINIHGRGKRATRRVAGRKPHRPMTAAVRKRISDGMKKKWAARKQGV
jgi:DNA invertase Pin-like site-specific DNA recombinase